MVENIDDNVGRLLAKLDELKLAGDTVVIFLTDNGPAIPCYNAGMLQRKGNTHEGGIRVPCFVRWAGRFRAGRTVEPIAAHIDIMPTLLDLCGVAKPAGVKFDGVSLAPLLRGDKGEWPDRTLYLQWHRGDVPEMYRAFAARSQRYKLVQPLGAQEGPLPDKLAFKLYDMAADPLEEKDIAADHPEIVARMKREYETWFKDVTGGRDYTVPSRIILGAAQEDPVLLTRQDWRGPQASWGPKGLGYWEVNVARAGDYQVTLMFPPLAADATLHFQLGKSQTEKKAAKGTSEVSFDGVNLNAGNGRLEAWINRGEDRVGVHYVEVKRRP